MCSQDKLESHLDNHDNELNNHKFDIRNNIISQLLNILICVAIPCNHLKVAIVQQRPFSEQQIIKNLNCIDHRLTEDPDLLCQYQEYMQILKSLDQSFVTGFIHLFLKDSASYSNIRPFTILCIHACMVHICPFECKQLATNSIFLLSQYLACPLHTSDKVVVATKAHALLFCNQLVFKGTRCLGSVKLVFEKRPVTVRYNIDMVRKIL